MQAFLPGVLTPLGLIAALAVSTPAAVSGGSPAGSQPSRGTILYRSAPSRTGLPAAVHLWTTDGTGLHAREVLTLGLVRGGEAFRGAFLTPGGLILAVADPNDGNVSDIEFLARSSRNVHVLFAVRGLLAFRPSPDGTRIAYTRALPVAGKPLLVIARRDGTIVRTLAHATGTALSWSRDARTVFAYGVTARCWLCAFSTATARRRPIELSLDNLVGGRPSVSPSGTRVAYPDAKGPAGERIYSTRGTFLRNIVGHAAQEALWSPDETRLLLQDDRVSVFSFTTRRTTAFAHDGPADLRVLDWQ